MRRGQISDADGIIFVGLLTTWSELRRERIFSICLVAAKFLVHAKHKIYLVLN